MGWSQPPKLSTLAKLKARLRKRWKKVREWFRPPEDPLERFVDSKIEDIKDARDYQDWVDIQMQGPEPPEEPEDHQKRMYEMDTEKEIDKLQGIALLFLYKSSKRLERFSKRLVLLTIVLAALTLILILVTVH